MLFIHESTRRKLRHALRLDRAVRLVWQNARSWMLANLALLLAQSALPVASLYLTKQIIDAVTLALSASDKNAAWQSAALWVGLAGALALLMEVCRSLTSFVNQAQAQLITDRMHEMLHAKSLAVDLEYYENAHYYDALHRAQQDAPFRPQSIVNSLMQAGQSGLSLLAIAGLLFSYNATLASLLFLATLPGLWVRLKYADQAYRWQRHWTASERRAYYYNWMLTSGEYAKEVRLFNLGPLFMQRFRALRETIRRERLAIATKSAFTELAPQVLATLAVFGACAFMAHQTIAGLLTLGAMVMYWQAFVRGQSFFRDLLQAVANLYQDNLFLSNLDEFLELKPRVAEPQQPRPFPRPMRKGIVFHGVSFRYPESSKIALQDIDLSLRPGETIALVGENGSGKTTLIKLLCRLYDPTTGHITLDGVDLRDYASADVRREIGVIFQDHAHYNLTAQENIWLGNVALPQQHERIPLAAQHAGADQVIAKLPARYQTVLGKWFEDGEELSIGEWQKIALSRAFLRDAQIIVLDEPTSAIDAKAEFAFFQRFRKLAKNRATVLISHRLSTVRLADNIYVLADGRLSENGTHEQLLVRDGVYAQLFETQARQYR